MTLEEFEQLVREALDRLPAQFARAMDNVEVVVELWPTMNDLAAGHTPPGSTLFGLYRGIPQTKRAGYNAVLPDKIVIFAGPLYARFGSDLTVLKREVRATVLHEIGHHFGMSDEEIRKAGK